jgi:hypothetical protein
VSQTPHDTEAVFKQRLKGAIVKRQKVAKRKSKRIKIPNAELTVRKIEFIDKPHYTAAPNAAAGGTRSWATLGPNALRSMKSDADSSLPTAIARARFDHGIDFKAGHLLNAELGGDGKNPANLTILTPSANSAHRAFDNPIKLAVAELYKAYIAMVKLGIDVEELGYGIEIAVETTGQYWGVAYPDDCITTGLSCDVNVVSAPDPGDWMDPGLDGWTRSARAAQQAIEAVDALVAQAQQVTDIVNAPGI